MKSVDIKEGKGPVENLYISDETDRPSPKEGQLLVKIHAFGLNRMDILQREGKYPLPPQAGPIMGVEFSGEVEEVGPGLDTSQWHRGDRVFGLAYGGAYAQYITNPAAMTIRMPEELSFEQCAGLPEVWFTAIQALYLVGNLDPAKKERVLIHAGASGVGLAAIQLCREAGCKKIYATAGSAKKLELCESMGATRAINYKEEDFGKVIQKDGEGDQEGAVDLILDFIGANYWDSNIMIAARDCRIVYLAVMSGSKKEIEIGPILFKRLRIQGTTLRSRDAEYQGNLRKKFEELALQHLIEGKFKAHIDKVYDWTEIKDAQGRMERNEGDGGKIICKVIHD
ncbi:protein of unknown function [Taphrina deformans PYCC 5710]|uniref:Enoyl reductase (ER) domain-containing protein n=1 Tax=Taphrina deformans (strain PYCC 5710 / ATCC 11124 / CBS 356.35 / IMI 108563 / JCM 9778 / NBRC 8474) TaxID=1097556 RepID=R4XLE4_TAPDE|nr:protein of unknown function [Taphrina deformans PYCC 5710]|eukprot:CCG84125.1 protein of unknown function [Taphrina deformans PYCC 5710]